ncbi:MAG: hypothetical protein GYA21_05850 [Myxococcales bacterium]|nr:hypothetical protein [Myxococcales bacterium]
MRPQDRERVLAECAQRVFERHAHDPQRLERAIFDTLYEERRRLETERKSKHAAAQSAYYDRVYAEAAAAAPERRRELLRELIGRFADEVVGHFDPRVYALATRVVPVGLNVLLNSLSPLRLAGLLPGGVSRLEDQLTIAGETEAFRRMVERGTTILVSTHASNLDSVLLGYALHRLGLPPYVYGAGLNLFSNPLIGFFMHHLGAYRVDRRKKAWLYKEVLKTYAGCTIEAGYHNMFFPGGTRSRSGAVESRLKLGLLGMGLDAYIRNLQANRSRPDVFIVPATLNYQLVLEAETLIEDHLKEAGKSRFIIEDDEFSKPRRVLDFVQRLFSLNSRITMVVGRPLDVFGNVVDDEGLSHDRRGRVVDRRRYVQRDGAVTFDAQRDEEYTRELASTLVESFRRHTVLQSTQVVSRVVFDWLRETNPELDLYRLLRTGGKESSLALPQAYARLEHTLKTLRHMEAEGRLRLEHTLKERDVVAVMSDALAHLGGYHRRAALVRRGDRLFHEDRNLILYYQNRLEGIFWAREASA